MFAFYCKIFSSLNEMLQSQGKVFDQNSQILQELFEDISYNHKFRNEKISLWLNYLENRE